MGFSRYHLGAARPHQWFGHVPDACAPTATILSQSMYSTSSSMHSIKYKISIAPWQYDSELLVTHNNLSLCATLQCCSGFPLNLGNHNSHNISNNNSNPRLFCLRVELLLHCSQSAHSRCASMPSSHSSGLTYHSAC